MSRRSDRAGAVLACGVVLGTLELLSIGAATRWPTVADPAGAWQRAKQDGAAGAPQRQAADEDTDETQASLELGQQLVSRADGVLDAVHLELASSARFRAQSPYDRFCPIARACD
jgi:hypothetical protein